MFKTIATKSYQKIHMEKGELKIQQECFFTFFEGGVCFCDWNCFLNCFLPKKALN